MIVVIVISGIVCLDIIFQGICELENCLDIIIEIIDVVDICFDNIVVVFDFVVIFIGNIIGILIWMGIGIIDFMVGIFDLLVMGFGIFNVIVIYEEMSCFYVDMIIIVVNVQLSVFFIVSGFICEDDISIVIYIGDGSVMVIYDWNFGIGIVVSGIDAGFYEISWVDGGNQIIILMVIENGCVFDLFLIMVEVVDLFVVFVIFCVSNNILIIFFWNVVVGVIGYQVNVIDVLVGVMEMVDLVNCMYIFSDFVLEDQVIIEVVVLIDNICGGVSSMQMCMSDFCSEWIFGIVGYGLFCEDEGV